jgi:hypothetical protein
MLKRIFTPGVFSPDTLRAVLESDVPVDARSDIDADLPSMVMEACQQWAQALSRGNRMTFEMDIVDDSNGPSVRELEEAYSRFFELCASREFNSSFAVRGSLSLGQKSDFSCIARWGGVIGLLGNVSGQKISTGDFDHPSHVADRLLREFVSSPDSAVSQCLADADAFISALIEAKDAYEDEDCGECIIIFACDS